MKKGFVLLGSIFLSLFIGVFLSISMIRFSMLLENMELRRASLYAFYAAEAGLERAVNELKQNVTWRDGFANQSLYWQEGTPQQELVGTYNVTVADGDPIGNNRTVWIRSEGHDAASRVTRVVNMHVELENPANFFISSISDVVIGSGAALTGNILGRDITFLINDTVPPEQRLISVDGDVEYIRNIFGHTLPEVTITGAVRQRAPFGFSGVDVDKYRALAQGGRSITGDFTYSGVINRSTLATTNGLVFVDGNLHISGTVTESIHFVASGNIYIENDIDCQRGGGVIAQIGLSANEDVLISATAPTTLSITAYIVADGGMFKAEGVPETKDTVNFNGSISVKGRAGELSAVALSVYNQRNYSYDTTLDTDMSIPYIAYLTHFLRWQEVAPTEPFPPAE